MALQFRFVSHGDLLLILFLREKPFNTIRLQCLRGFVVHFFVALLILTYAHEGSAKDKRVTYSLQAMALAPNAGGQMAFALRRGTNENELSAFANTYLYAGDYPLLGAIYAWRFPIVNDEWFWQFYVQLGAGISTAGPVAEILWGTIMLWTVRVDIATHVLFIPNRVILWSYPVWVGISIPL